MILMADDSAIAISFNFPVPLGRERKSKIEQGDSINKERIHIESIVLIGSERNDLPLRYMSKLMIMIIKIVIQSGIPRYHRPDFAFASMKNLAEPKNDIIPNKPDVINKR